MELLRKLPTIQPSLKTSLIKHSSLFMKTLLKVLELNLSLILVIICSTLATLVWYSDHILNKKNHILQAKKEKRKPLLKTLLNWHRIGKDLEIWTPSLSVNACWWLILTHSMCLSRLSGNYVTDTDKFIYFWFMNYFVDVMYSFVVWFAAKDPFYMRDTR